MELGQTDITTISGLVFCSRLTPGSPPASKNSHLEALVCGAGLLCTSQLPFAMRRVRSRTLGYGGVVIVGGVVCGGLGRSGVLGLGWGLFFMVVYTSGPSQGVLEGKPVPPRTPF